MPQLRNILGSGICVRILNHHLLSRTRLLMLRGIWLIHEVPVYNEPGRGQPDGQPYGNREALNPQTPKAADPSPECIYFRRSDVWVPTTCSFSSRCSTSSSSPWRRGAISGSANYFGMGIIIESLISKYKCIIKISFETPTTFHGSHVWRIFLCAIVISPWSK